MSTLKEQGIKAFLWDFLGKISTHGMSFIVSIFLARLLEPSDFGLVAIVMIIVSMASIFVDFGLGSALIQKKRLLPIHYTSVFYFNLVVGLTLSFITYFSSSLISIYYNNEKLLPIVQILSILFTINSIGSVQSIRYRKELKYSILTKIGLVSSLFSGTISILLAIYDYGVWSLVVQILLMSLTYNIIIFFYAKWIPELKFSFKALKSLWNFGLRIFLANGLDVVTTKLDFIIIGKLYPVDILGYFQRAKSLNSLIIEYSSGGLMSVLFPLLSRVQNNLQIFQHIIVSSLGIIIFVVFFLMGNFYLVSQELIVLLFSVKWLPSVHYFQLLILSGISYPINALLVNVLMSRGKSKLFLKLTLYKKIFFIINLYIGFQFGINGYLYGLILVSLIGIYMNSMYVSKELSLNIFLLIKPILIQICISVVSLILTTSYIMLFLINFGIITFIVKIIIYSVIYIILNYLFKVQSYLFFKKQFLQILNKGKK
jgi:O-antigen/teichoic acid export membrane protein